MCVGERIFFSCALKSILKVRHAERVVGVCNAHVWDAIAWCCWEGAGEPLGTASGCCLPLWCDTMSRCVGFCPFSGLGGGGPGFITPCALLQQLLSQQRGKETSGPARNVPGARYGQHLLPAQVNIEVYWCNMVLAGLKVCVLQDS